MRQRSLLFTLILCVGLIGSAAAQPASHADMAKTADAVKSVFSKI